MKILDCPICKIPRTEGQIMEDVGFESFTVFCDECGLMPGPAEEGQSYTRRRDAIRGWNRFVNWYINAPPGDTAHLRPTER